MKVRAKELGYFSNQRKYKGSVFTLTPYKTRDGKTVSAEQQFSSRWMEKVESETPEVLKPKVPIVGQHGLDQKEEQSHVMHPGADMKPTPKPEPAKEPEKTTEQPGAKKSSGEADVI